MAQLFFSTEERKTIEALEAEKTQLENNYKQTAQAYVITMHELQDKLKNISESIKKIQIQINTLKQPSN